MIERVYYTTDKEILIKPCPICNRDPSVCRERSDYDDYLYHVHIECVDCGIQTRDAGYYTHHHMEECEAVEEVAKIWNRLPRTNRSIDFE